MDQVTAFVKSPCSMKMVAGAAIGVVACKFSLDSAVSAQIPKVGHAFLYGALFDVFCDGFDLQDNLWTGGASIAGHMAAEYAKAYGY